MPFRRNRQNSSEYINPDRKLFEKGSRSRWVANWLGAVGVAGLMTISVNSTIESSIDDKADALEDTIEEPLSNVEEDAAEARNYAETANARLRFLEVFSELTEEEQDVLAQAFLEAVMENLDDGSEINSLGISE